MKLLDPKKWVNRLSGGKRGGEGIRGVGKTLRREGKRVARVANKRKEKEKKLAWVVFFGLLGFSVRSHPDRASRLIKREKKKVGWERSRKMLWGGTEMAREQWATSRGAPGG